MMISMLVEDKVLEENAKCTLNALDSVYHSESMHEMKINADLHGVDLCNPYVLFYLACTTAYHHAFWPHTAKRFTAFKSLLRYDANIRRAIALDDGVLWTPLMDKFKPIDSAMNSNIYTTLGRKKQWKNLKQIIDIVEKCIAEHWKNKDMQ